MRYVSWRGFSGFRRFLAAAFAGWMFAAGGLQAESGAVVVEMTNTLKFVPEKLTVPVGTTVEWRNASVLVHTVTADPEKAARPESAALPDGAAPFDSGSLEVDGTYRHTFTTAGTYRYFCIPHEGAGMVGTIVVRP
ncbi:MAG: hypothetical protein Kow0060_18760 [Methylohalobius crimeensis]